jgi:hypothetical protein
VQTRHGLIEISYEREPFRILWHRLSSIIEVKIRYIPVKVSSGFNWLNIGSVC